MTESRVIATPIGSLWLTVEAGRLIAVDYGPARVTPREASNDPLLDAVVEWLNHYFDQPTDPWPNPPLALHGTPFQQRVWGALQQIPVGETMSYGALARMVGSSPRAVGGACRRNPILILVPCHRVVSITGVGGYAGEWGSGSKVEIKQWLLRHEGSPPPCDRAGEHSAPCHSRGGDDAKRVRVR